MKLTISPQKIALGLFSLILFLTCIAVLGQFSKYVLGHDYLLGIVPLFDLSEDSAVPTWYASSTLLLCSILLFIIAQNKRKEKEPFVTHWIILAAVFLCLSIDETARIHETMGDMLNAKMGETKGYFYYTWVVFGLSFVSVFALSHLRFLFSLPLKTKLLFILAGTIYVGGALGLEMVNGHYDELYGHHNLTYQLMTAFEEFLEMVGIAVFVYALTSYMVNTVREVTLCIEEVEPVTKQATVTITRSEPALSNNVL
jgi:heme exporter protein D